MSRAQKLLYGCLVGENKVTHLEIKPMCEEFRKHGICTLCKTQKLRSRWFLEPFCCVQKTPTLPFRYSLLCARTSFVAIALLGIEEWDNRHAPISQNGLSVSPVPVSIFANPQSQAGQLWETV